MFHEESLITTIFKLLNVAVLFGVGFYFFKTRVLLSIQEMIAAKKREEKALAEEKRNLAANLKTVEREIVEQQKLSEKIKEHVHQWQEQVAADQKRVDHEVAEQAAAQEIRVRKQSSHLSSLKLQQQVLPQALIDAHRELEAHFAQQQGQAYMQNTIRYMRKV